MSDDDVLVPDGPHYAMPPLSPESDGEVAAEDHNFSVRCWEMVSRRLDQNSRQMSGPLVSRHPIFGLVWRMDYEGSDPRFSRMINRFMCWRSPDGEQFFIEHAVYQKDLSPLPKKLS